MVPSRDLHSKDCTADCVRGTYLETYRYLNARPKRSPNSKRPMQSGCEHHVQGDAPEIGSHSFDNPPHGPMPSPLLHVQACQKHMTYTLFNKKATQNLRRNPMPLASQSMLGNTSTSPVQCRGSCNDTLQTIKPCRAPGSSSTFGCRHCHPTEPEDSGSFTENVLI